MKSYTPSEQSQASLPKQGRPAAELGRLLDEAGKHDADWRNGRTGAYVFWAGDDVLQVAKDAYLRFFSENGLSPKAFPSLARFESEVLSMTAGLLNGESAVGSLTSGGTESIVMAVKTARDRARAERGIEAPEMVMPYSAHPAFNKAAHYLGIKAIRTRLDENFEANVGAMREAINDNTVLLVGSAPQYPHGVIDPIPALAALAEERNISFHVDACVGGFFLPFLRKLGYPLPDFDFSVPGVTSISADLHKFGFTAKGASVVLYRDREIHQHQVFNFTDWPIGAYSSPGVAGTRPGGAIAAAWAVLQYLGEDGYLKLVQTMMATCQALFDGINSIPDMEVWGKPVMSCFSYGSRTMDMSAVSIGMNELGWFVNRQADPPGIHMFVTPAHATKVTEYLHDLALVADRVKRGEIRTDESIAAYN